MNQRVYLALPAEMLQELPRSLAELVQGQGVSIPNGIVFSEGPVPSCDGSASDKDWGIIIDIAQCVAEAGIAVSMIILAISQFLKDRAREPRVFLVDEITETTAPDGTVTRQMTTKPMLVEPGPQLRAELGARLKGGRHLVVNAKLET